MNELSTTIHLPTIEATHALGLQLAKSLPVPSVILLEGDLGAGKTTLIQGLAVGLGITELVVSPTFNLINEYHEGRTPLYHFDLYRLTPEETVNLYPEIYWESVEFPAGIVAIEWAERLLYRPSQYLLINLTNTENGRMAELRNIGNLELKFLC